MNRVIPTPRRSTQNIQRAESKQTTSIIPAPIKRHPGYTVDYNLVSKLYGRKFAQALKDLGFTDIFDVNDWIKKEAERKISKGKIEIGDVWSLYPSIDSIFSGGGGSYIYDDNKYGSIYVQNGTLAGIGKLDNVPFGEEYYRHKYGKTLITRDYLFNYEGNLQDLLQEL